MDIVARAVSRVCGLQAAQVCAEGELLGYGLDSLRSMELICELEEELGLQIDEADPRLLEVRTLRQFAGVVDGMRGLV